jgi:ketosteroid isomerase-like protein
MSQENVEIVRAGIDAYNRGDWEAVLKDAGPGFELDMSRALGPQNEVYGRDQVPRFWAEFAEGWESVRVEPHEFIEQRDNVVVPWTLHLIGRDRIEVQARVTLVWTFRDGALERICLYQDRADALEAVGLRE